MLSNCRVGEDLRVPWTAGDQTSQFKGNQSLIFIKRTDAETEAPIL